MKTISNIVTILNEEKNIRGTITSLQKLCDTDIIMNYYNTNNAINIAPKTTTIIYQHFKLKKIQT